MRKFFVILAFFAFTQNVKADNQYLDWDFTAAEGEDITVERVIALQFAKGEWDENTTNMWDYLLNGQNMRVYRHIVDDIDQPQDYYIYTAVGHKYYDDLLHIYYVDYSIDRQYESDLTVGELIDRIIQLNTSEYRLLSAVSNDGQNETYSNVKYTQQGWTVGEDDNGEYLNLGSTVSSPALDDYGNNASAVAQVLTDDSLRKSLLQYASIPLNDVKITITNSVGQVTSQHDYTSYLVSIQSLLGQVNSNLTDLKNALGFSGVGDDNLESFLAQWRTTDGINQGNILTNLTQYTDFLRLLVGADGYSTSHLTYIDLFNQLLAMERLARNARYAHSGTRPYLELYGVPYTTWAEKITTLNNAFFPNENLLSYEGLNAYLSLRNQYQDQYIELRKYGQLTNIIDGVDLGRDWLNLATNDLNSFTYWLNQQDFTPLGSNDVDLVQKRFDAITNQYARISLTGNGQQANSAETWNYWKRLEMLLAALVYKNVEVGKVDGPIEDKQNDGTVSASMTSAENDVQTSLNQVVDALQVNKLEGAKNNIVTLFQRAVNAFDVEGDKPVINVLETDYTSGGDSSGVTVNLSFQEGMLGDWADFLHHFMGFIWGFSSLFIFWRVCKWCWDMGYKVVKFQYSLIRKFLGS